MKESTRKKTPCSSHLMLTPSRPIVLQCLVQHGALPCARRMDRKKLAA